MNMYLKSMKIIKTNMGILSYTQRLSYSWRRHIIPCYRTLRNVSCFYQSIKGISLFKKGEYKFKANRAHYYIKNMNNNWRNTNEYVSKE